MSAAHILTAPVRCVVDASVAIKAFVIEEHSDAAVALLTHLADVHAELSVPDLFYIEMSNIFWQLARRERSTEAQARADVNDLVQLRFVMHPMTGLVEQAVDLALRHQITAYDASYLALAERLQVPLITADDKLIAALTRSRTKFDVRQVWHIADVAIDNFDRHA